MKNKTVLFLLLVMALLSNQLFSQTNNALSSSPFSLYGLGVINETGTGKINTLGKFGFAFQSLTEINNRNPASYGGIGTNSFFFDFGLKVKTETITDFNSTNTNVVANFSDIAFAFAITKKSGIGLSLIPYTAVGYNIFGIETPIEGSSQVFFTDAYGSGGISDLKLNYGYALNKNLRLGTSITYLFGQITQTQTSYILDNVFQIEDKNDYSGLRFGFGLQYEYSKKLAFGSVLNLPVTLSASQTKNITQTYGDAETFENKLDNFKLPLEFGLGLKTNLNENLTFNADYKKSFWDNTNQSDYLGDYIDQDFLGFGLEYLTLKSDLKYLNTVQYRLGFNYDNGNLLVDHKRINNYAINLGLGFPLRKDTNSILNINYSYGNKGRVSNGLVKENYHLISINFSLEGIWFLKRKYN